MAVVLLAFTGVLAKAEAGAESTPEPPAGLDQMPSATRDDVVRALAEVRREYGEDAVLIETQLLINAMRNGSLRATSVSVDGVKPYRGKTYLGFIVETGLIFDSKTRDLAKRVHLLWSTIMVPTLERLKASTVPAEGIKVALQYHHRPYDSRHQLRASIDQPGTSEEAIFYLLKSDVRELAANRLSARHLLNRALVTVDGQERALEIGDQDPPVAPGPE